MSVTGDNIQGHSERRRDVAHVHTFGNSSRDHNLSYALASVVHRSYGLVDGSAMLHRRNPLQRLCDTGTPADQIENITQNFVVDLQL
jgi:hypothetical protein